MNIKQATFRVLCRMGADHLSRRRLPDRLLIVCYHGVVNGNSGQPGSWLMLPASEFERQIDYLHSNYEIISMTEAAERLCRRERFTRPTACVTFDDGYKNNATVAAGILERYGVPATIYLATGFVGTRQVHWTVRLERALMDTTLESINLHDLGLGSRPYPLQENCSQTFVQLCSRLYRLPYKQRQSLVSLTIDRLGGFADPDFSDFEMMSWEDITALDNRGLFEFGGHTVHHQIVEPLDDDELRGEIGGSIIEVSQNVTHASRTFAYPNGTPADFDSRAEPVLRAHGIIAAVSTIEGLNTSQTKPYALHRVTIGSGMGLDEFRLRVSGTVQTLKGWLRNNYAEN